MFLGFSIFQDKSASTTAVAVNNYHLGDFKLNNYFVSRENYSHDHNYKSEWDFE